tara:strand:- start:46 stop:171 length:126 start_codon:yes stop_codon:yes gene_type:complete
VKGGYGRDDKNEAMNGGKNGNEGQREMEGMKDGTSLFREKE